jgi:hypothetical protein
MNHIQSRQVLLRHELYIAIERYLGGSHEDRPLDRKDVSIVLETLATLCGVVMFLLIGHEHEVLAQALTVLQRDAARGYRTARKEVQ